MPLVRISREGLCLADGCGRPRIGKGYCSKHYQRLAKHGNITGSGVTQKGEAREYFDTVVLHHAGDECLIWPFSRNGSGYGNIGIDGKTYLVSRLVCEEVNGPPPTAEHEAAHSCGLGHEGCCSPQHLNWATRVENQRDRLRHGTSPRGEQCGMAKLTQDDVRQIRAMRGEANHAVIADKFGVASSTVCMIQTGKSWGWLT